MCEAALVKAAAFVTAAMEQDRLGKGTSRPINHTARIPLALALTKLLENVF